MSARNIQVASLQITSSTAAKTLYATTANQGFPPDIDKLIISNTSSTSTLVTLSDGVNNYYYSIGPNTSNPVTIDSNTIPSDRASTAWTVQCGTSVASIYITAIMS